MSTQTTQSYKSLMRGLRELDLRGPCVPSDLVLTGDHAFPLAMNIKGQVLMAASLYGRGRVVVLGHEGYLTAFPALVENAVTWLRGEGSYNVSVGIHRQVRGVPDNLSKSSFQVAVVGAFSENRQVGVYVTDAYSVEAEAKELVAFLKAGGGVLIAGQAWHWAQMHPEENAIVQFPGNKVSAVAEIYFTESYGEVEILPVSPEPPSSWRALRVVKDPADDLEFLLKGVSDFTHLGDILFSEALVHGPLSFPICTGDDGRAVLAGSYYGQGRVILITHEYPLKLKGLALFWKNAIGWLDQGRQGVVGVAPKLHLPWESGLKHERTEFREDLSVFVCTAYSDDHKEEIQDFVAQGGGLLIGGHSWHWAQGHSQQNPMTDFHGNKILNKMGLSVSPETVKQKSYKVPLPSKTKSDTDHFLSLLRLFAGHVTQGETLSQQKEEKLVKLRNDCVKYLKMEAHSSYNYTQVLSLLTDILKFMPQVSSKNPVEKPKDLFLLTIAAEVYDASPDPDALLAIFTEPPMASVQNQRLNINADTAERTWISTGLYLSPGMRTEMIVPANIVNKNWVIQIGCQTDYLRHKKLHRAPSVCKHIPVTSEKMQVSNLWGGLIYLVAPPNATVKGAEVIVKMAIAAPYYKSAVTTAADWSLLRKAPSPWAELEFDNVILTVPSDVVRDLEGIDDLAARWNGIMRAVADLAVKPRTFTRKERIVADVQISAGWMHSGYPIMGPTAVAADLVGPKNMWGPLHELGHNQQRSGWEFRPYTTECTCNLWSVYVHEEVLGISREQAHSNMALTYRKTLVDEFVAGGQKLSDWNMWVALQTYLQLQEKFGWDAFKKVFAAYHQMTTFPQDNDGKMNLYAETFSQAVGMNLSAFFKAWGWPIQAATEEKLSTLPPWSDHAMVQHG
ncbi:uncharacterized protein ACO6RY_01079 [Pungitius sinensis]